jgi:serine phosphatase RsbU (regulator of sigma subunit)
MVGKTLFRPGKRAANPPLGVSPGLTPLVSAYQFSRGACTIMFTDGVVDQRNRDGAEYSEPRLWKILKTNSGLSPQALKETLLADFESFRGDQPPADDLTLLILKNC